MKKFSVFIFTLLLLAGCAKNETYIYGWSPDINDPDNVSPHEKDVLISFSASLESRHMTRAMSPMPKGVISEVYSYKTTDSRLSDPFTEGLYITSSAGILTGMKGYKMYLNNGSYNMYALSCNSSAIPPEINNGETEPLKNGVDYLWWENLDQDVTTSQVHVPIVFQHVSTQVVIEVSGGDNLKLDSLISASILPPTPGASLHLEIGIIDPARTYDKTPFSMGINKFLAQAIILPVTSDEPMPLTLTILANGETVPRTYTASIPIPSKLAGGFSYLFSAIINGNTISFSDASIKDWTDVDETGNPIYPN